MNKRRYKCIYYLNIVKQSGVLHGKVWDILEVPPGSDLEENSNDHRVDISSERREVTCRGGREGPLSHDNWRIELGRSAECDVGKEEFPYSEDSLRFTEEEIWDGDSMDDL